MGNAPGKSTKLNGWIRRGSIELYLPQPHKRSPQLTLGDVLDDSVEGDAGFVAEVSGGALIALYLLHLDLRAHRAFSP